MNDNTMRILVAHNRYQFSGGEDSVVRDEIEMLRRRGHSIELLERDNVMINGIRGALTASSSIFYSADSRKQMKKAIQYFRPDILHIHNWFPLLSPSIILEADSSRVPIIQTLHNYRMVCANALLYRDGEICTECIGKSLSFNGFIHGCYRNSRVGSAVVTAAYAFHRLIHTWDSVDIFLAVSDFQREILIRGGLPADRIIVKPNFVDNHSLETVDILQDTALFVGRLSQEKGIKTLLAAWSSGKIQIRLKIIGDGPMVNEVRACAASNPYVEYLGSRPSEVIYREMAKAKYLVFPSEWYETFGRTVIEAFSQGTPVLAADLGCVRELVEDGVTGYLFPPKNVDALVAGALRFLSGEDNERMRANCRNKYLSKYTADINYPLLISAYEKAIAIRKSHQREC